MKYNTPKSSSKKGFTLIELSIVLVIIGLIVGGVLVGQDLIAAAETRAQMSQIEKTNTAVNTFRVKYNVIPGDMNAAKAITFGFAPRAGTTDLGDGDGIIDAVAGDQCGETFNFWGDLSQAGLQEGSVAALPAAASNSECFGGGTYNTAYLPDGKLGGKLTVFSDSGSNRYHLSNATLVGATGGVTETASIKNQQAYNIDLKLDDGVPTTGSVIAVTGYNTPVAAAGTCMGADNTVYDLATDGAGNETECMLEFRAQF